MSTQETLKAIQQEIDTKEKEIAGMRIEEQPINEQDLTKHACEMAEKTKVHNHRQNQQIIPSLKERELIAQGVSSLLDWAIANGANGTAHRAKDALCVPF